MIIEDTVENAIVTLLQVSTTGINVYRGMRDASPSLTLPALVVTADMPQRHGNSKREIYDVRVIIEYKSIPEENTVAGASGIESEIGQVDAALTTQPNFYVLSQIPLGAAKELSWHSLNRTQQEVHTDRRTNTREIMVVLAFS